MSWVEDELRGFAAGSARIGLQDIIGFLRTTRLTGDTAGYGQIVPLVKENDANLRMMWHAHVGEVAAPFVPVFLGIESVPAEFRQHRYLSDGEAARFVDVRNPDQLSRVPRSVEAARSATEVFKCLLYLTFEHPDPFLGEVQSTWTALERRLMSTAADAVALGELALVAGRRDLLRRHLTRVVHGELLRSLDIGESLARSLDVMRQLRFGVCTDPTPEGPEQTW